MAESKKHIKNLLDTVIASPLMVVYYMIRALPAKAAVKLCRFLAQTAHFLKIRRGVVEQNLEVAFPEMSPEERRSLIRRIYINIGEFLGSWLTLPALKNSLHQYINMVDQEVIEAIKPADKGLLICSAHFGHWELLAAAYAEIQKRRLTIVRHKLNNSRLDRWFTDVHELMGFNDIIKGKSLLEIFRRLRRDEDIGMLVDQSGRGAGIWIPFFNRPTSFHRGPGMIVSKSGCPAITAFCVPSETGGWEMRFRRMNYELTGDLEKDTYSVMREYARHLEDVIREFPDRYFWFHRRWKTRVPPEIREAWRAGRML